MDHLVLFQEPDCEQFLRTMKNLRLLSLGCAVNEMYQHLALF